jgi:hypothetical protein
MFCLGFLLLNTGCEKSADQTTPSIVRQLTNRDGDGPCDNCDIDDCCCGFELRHPIGDATTFRVCGFDNGTSTCNPSSPTGCNTINGGFAQQLLSTETSINFAFCMLQGNCFQITNMTFGSSGDIKISCDYDQITPTFTNVTIPYLSSFTFCVDGSCDFDQCDP